jgi:hypothetical protein
MQPFLIKIRLDYDNQKPDKVEAEGKITIFKTNNPKVFWEH